MSDARKQLPEQCLRDAAEWYWTIRDEDVSDETIVAWQLWLSVSPDHKWAFDRIESAIEIVDDVEAPSWPTGQEIVDDPYDGSVSVKEWSAQNHQPEKDAERSHLLRILTRKSSRIWAIAASLFLAVMVGAVFKYQSGAVSESPPDYALYQTQSAEHREISLADGSTIALGGKSAVSVAYSERARVVVLQSGEAYFNVATDESRPFIVEASGREIIAVGTAFNVSRHDVRVVVTVTEGTVIVAPESGRANDQTLTAGSHTRKTGETARLEVGQMLVYDDKALMPIAVADPADALAWRNGLLKYRGEKLRFVIEDVERYIEYPIILVDPAVGELKYTGTVFQNSADTWVYGLEDAFSLIVSDSASAVLIDIRTDEEESN